MTEIKNLKKGDFFKLNENSKIVYIRGDYDRELKKYECFKFDDINDFRYFKGDKKVFTEFVF